jgi:hypothetical protein
MFEKLKTRLLFTLLAHRLGVVADRHEELSELDISDYTFTVMENNGLRTVEDALFAYCLHNPTPGIGQGSWNDFLNNVS